MPIDISAGIFPVVPYTEVEHSQVFPLASSNLLKVRKGDITKWSVDGHCDAIVNSTNVRMLAEGGADAAIHRAAGLQLGGALYDIPEMQPGVRCPTGQARITPNSLMAAKANRIEYIAFPAVCCGTYGYPSREAATVAISTVKEFAHDFKEVHFVLLMDEVFDNWLDKTRELLPPMLG
ncbi:macro domain-containing protein VPA0103 isoform X2 [Manihot esculenta]|uniref:Macro domain-containing protein n=1 Tax=Manihot esculenta TaxID=3983 RepID=A0A2C9V368_MANES|nr:macro domain-containing protein VPA0103 isoform X2 [Manihot esculenta]OAY38258.1 hypothetical protein MANES_10G000800v8 [Manihot esculenta]